MTFRYTSKCCNAPAKKPACERSRNDLKEGKMSECGLGKWRCMNCKNVTAVTRERVD